MNVRWIEISIAIGCSLPFLSLAFVGMGFTRYFRDPISTESKRLVRWSLLTYGFHWVPIVAPSIANPKTDFPVGDIFWWGSFAGALLLLLASAWMGLRSRQASGRRAAMASVLILGVYVVYGEIFYINLMGRIAE
jgi:hypothetical protein